MVTRTSALTVIRRSSRRRKLPTAALAAAGAAIAASVVVSGPVGAIVGGEIDHEQHRYVAAIGQPDGEGIVFSGVLVSPTVVLTVAHAAVRLQQQGFTEARVTFDPVADDSAMWHLVAIQVNPAYDPTSSNDPQDLAVIVLNAPIADRDPASLPIEGHLDMAAGQARHDESFEVVGYGLSSCPGKSSGGGQFSPDFQSGGTRKTASQRLNSITSGWARLNQLGDSHVCIGDSGAPTLVAGTDVIAGITVGRPGNFDNIVWDQRIDTKSTRMFLAQYVVLP